MKKLTITLLTGVLILSCAGTSFAIEKNTRTYKLRRGAINIISSPFEIPKQMLIEQKAAKERNEAQFIGLIGGMFKGLAYMGGRLGTGLWDALTFNVEIPANYEPVMQPEYVCGDWPGKNK